MRGRWRNFENKQSEKAIVGSTCNPKKVSIGTTLWMLLAGITMLLNGCGGGPYRAYYYQDDQHYRYYETKSGDVLLVSPGGQVGNATSFVGGQGYPSIMKEARGSVSGNGPKPEPPAPEVSKATWSPWSRHEEGQLAWNNGPKLEQPAPEVSKAKWFPWGNWPLSPPASEPAAQSPTPDNERPPSSLPMVGATTWKSDVADWDMASYAIAPETGACKPYALSITAASFSTPYDPFFKKRSCWNVLWDVPASLLGDALMGALIILKGYGSLMGMR